MALFDDQFLVPVSVQDFKLFLDDLVVATPNTVGFRFNKYVYSRILHFLFVLKNFTTDKNTCNAQINTIQSFIDNVSECSKFDFASLTSYHRHCMVKMLHSYVKLVNVILNNAILFQHFGVERLDASIAHCKFESIEGALVCVRHTRSDFDLKEWSSYNLKLGDRSIPVAFNISNNNEALKAWFKSKKLNLLTSKPVVVRPRSVGSSSDEERSVTAVRPYNRDRPVVAFRPYNGDDFVAYDERVNNFIRNAEDQISVLFMEY